MDGKVVAVCTSEEKGTRKTPRDEGALLVEEGLKGDAHSGPWHRQVSLLALESIEKMQAAGLAVGPGDFAENLTTEGVTLHTLPLGTRFLFENGAILEVTQIGKVCHDRCAIYYQAGDCVMPREGIFARVISGGSVRPGDRFQVVLPQD
ncbi:MAG: MOSC domain-containing protein [Bacillota bacterium]